MHECPFPNCSASYKHRGSLTNHLKTCHDGKMPEFHDINVEENREVVQLENQFNNTKQPVDLKQEIEVNQSDMQYFEQEGVEKLIIAFLERRQFNEAKHLSDNAVVKDRAKYASYVEKGLVSCRKMDAAAFAGLTELRQKVPNWAQIEAKITQDHKMITVQDAVLFKNAALYAYKYSIYNLDHNMSQRKQALEVMSDSCELFANHTVHRNDDRHPPRQQLGLFELLRLKLAEVVAVYRLQLIICILSVFAVFLLFIFWRLWKRQHSIPMSHFETTASNTSR